MRYYILQDDKGDLIQVDSITRKTSSWSNLDNFISLDVFIKDISFWDKNNPKFDTYGYRTLLTSDEKITKRSHPELFI